MIKKLFGGKSDGFFLELDETGNNQSTETKVETATKEETKQPKPVAETKEEAKQPEPVATKSATKGKKTSIKSKKQKSAPTAPTASPVSSDGASSGEQPSWVKAMEKSNSSSSNGSSAEGEQTFATDNLLPTPSTYRRRPGPSLNKFKEMARQAKTPRR